MKRDRLQICDQSQGDIFALTVCISQLIEVWVEHVVFL
jgi:hypothetical protein